MRGSQVRFRHIHTISENGIMDSMLSVEAVHEDRWGIKKFPERRTS
jgi:hypothetical protein